MYEFKSYALSAIVGMTCATLIILCVSLSRWLAARFGVSGLKRKIIFALLTSPVYFFICAVSGIPIFFKTDVMGFRWFTAMFAFAVCIFPANMVVLLRPKNKTLLIILGIGLYLVIVAYMVLFPVLTA